MTHWQSFSTPVTRSGQKSLRKFWSTVRSALLANSAMHSPPSNITKQNLNNNATLYPQSDTAGSHHLTERSWGERRKAELGMRATPALASMSSHISWPVVMPALLSELRMTEKSGMK